MKKVKTNKEELFGQFEFSSSEMIFFLDTQTGEKDSLRLNKNDSVNVLKNGLLMNKLK